MNGNLRDTRSTAANRPRFATWRSIARASRGRALLWAVAAIGAVAALFVVRAIDPADPADGHFYPFCVFHQLTGLHCPGCGTLRAMHQLLHGNLAAALRMNVLSVCLLPIMFVVVVRNAVGAWRGIPVVWHRPRWVPAGWRWGVVILIVGFGILRNVPAWPFTLLAPH